MKLKEAVANKTAKIELLGDIFSFFGFRHEFAFCIVINDSSFYENSRFQTLIDNAEEAVSATTRFIPLKAFEKFVEEQREAGHPLHDCSAALYKLFLESELYKEIQQKCAAEQG